ncbi:hypothetical protein GALL_229760 [mine drainage metagenome]|uniref:Uncharacterized protein n=1 Tax=mine drainage metagenome TaxID=410659 RepID=A0A1J5RSJ6_9ZZZZ
MNTVVFFSEKKFLGGRVATIAAWPRMESTR